MNTQAEQSLLRMFGSGLSQHARLLTLTSAQERHLPQSLVVERVRGREAVNELFVFDVDALSVSTDLELDTFLGEELTLGLLQPDGSRRAWHGLCTQAAWQGTDGGVARYRLRMEPSMALLKHRRDCFIFQDKDAQAIVTEVLADYPQIRFCFEVAQQASQRAIVTQYRESDFDFLERILAAEGLIWRFEHDQDSGGDDQDPAGHARHRVVFFDSGATAPPTPGGAIIRFHGVRATEVDDTIDEMRAHRLVQANAVGISSWDPDQLHAPAAGQLSGLDAGTLPEMEVYDGSGERIATDNSEAHSELMLRAFEMENKRFSGTGAVRRLAAGHGFELTQHERFPGGDNRFTVLSIEHEARNNIGSQIKGAQHATEAGTYRNSFVCVRDTVPIVPAAIGKVQARTAHGPQTAMVAGISGAQSTTTREHRVKVQFAWQRGACPNAGGLAHGSDAQGNAPGDETSGTWVRVAEALAGPNWGTQFTPRIGTEVLVDFIEGDIDRPLIVAQLYNGADLPPFRAGVDSGANHAGALSGIHSRNFDGAGFNQWQIDDSTGQLRMRLATSTGSTQLNLGYLVGQTIGTSHRGSYRGSGFELRTDAWGVVRGGDGVMLSTSAREELGSSVASTQMDAAEAVSRFGVARDLMQSLHQAAQAQGAACSAVGLRAVEKLSAQIDPAKQGKHQGDAPFKPDGDTRELDYTRPVERFAAPIVLMDSAASINWASPASTAIYAGEDISWTSASDTHLSAGHTASAVAANAASMYSHAGGIQAIAANGPVSLQAHTDQLEILADESITIISVNDAIEIAASKRIVIQAGSAAITLDGANITFACPGNFTVKSVKQDWDGGARNQASFAPLPNSSTTLFHRTIQLVDQDSLTPLSAAPYFIRLDSGVVFHGMTDHEGFTEIPKSDQQEMAKVFVGHAALLKIAEITQKVR